MDRAIIRKLVEEFNWPKKRRRHSNQFKFKVALEASKGLKTLNEIASETVPTLTAGLDVFLNLYN